LSNVYFAQLGWWPLGTSHLWSLAVEEQFYLLWPALILFLPRRWMLPALLMVIAVGPIFRYSGMVAGVDGVALYTLPFSSMDSLGLGALIAFLDRVPSHRVPWRSYFTFLALGIALPTVTGLTVFALPEKFRALEFALHDFFMSLVFGWVILGAKTGYRNPFGRLLAWSPLVYLGRISYGLYVYHLFIPEILPRLPEWFGVGSQHDQPWTYFLVYSGISVLMASLSWFLFEAPINRLKRFFPYRASRGTSTDGAPVVLEDALIVQPDK
jgi:peptidoglycan/LPS O-acetylase OafA/YrhL